MLCLIAERRTGPDARIRGRCAACRDPNPSIPARPLRCPQPNPLKCHPEQEAANGPHAPLTIRTLLRALLGALLMILIAALAVPTWSAIHQLRDASRVVAIARAGQSVFGALQYLRPERGSVQVGLTAPAPAEAALLTSLAAMRLQSAAAFKR